MTILARAVHAFEAAPMPDSVRRAAVAMLVANTSRQLKRSTGDAASSFAEDMRGRPIAEHTDAANAQHYEVPADFFRACLGPHMKYSCCRFEEAAETLAQAEARALAETAANAELADGQRILELGCGWGSLTLWVAERYPNASITAVSNSASQRAHIEAVARQRGLGNVNVVTADANAFETQGIFDRIVSIEMFEHMSNWRALLEKCRRWLAPDGRLLIHVFAHKSAPYRFDVENRDDWIAQHFFSGGIMPSRDLIRRFPDLFTVDREWWWNGRNYERTALAWLQNFDDNIDVIRPILNRTYGNEARVWETRWRLFFLATAGLFGHDRGEEWGVVQHLLRPVT